MIWDAAGLKDIIYFIVFASSLATLWSSFGNRIKNTELAVSLLKRIIFKESGELAIMTSDGCDRKQAAIINDLAVTKRVMTDISEEIKELNKNVLIIMIHLNIDTTQVNGGRKSNER